MNISNGLAVVVTVFLLAACGGGGGGSGDSVASTSTTVITGLCPDGSAVPATETATCPIIGPTTTPIPATLDPEVIQANGYSFSFTGTLDPASITAQNVKLWLGAADTGVAVSGTPVLSADKKTITYTPVQRPAFGQAYTLVAQVHDSLDRAVTWSASFTTVAMVCADNAIWSNPANYSSVYRDCVAPIGVQAKVDQAYNKMQDNTCTIALDAPLSVACQAYLANGTMMLAETSIVANSHLVTWMAYIGMDGKSNLVLLDTNDPTNASPVPVATLALPSPLAWLIGNTTGTSVRTADGKTSLASLDATNHIILTCLVGC